ncbi:MAG TPA: thioredoxin-disulfide reductase [candidate division Zixibacteria bacterium]|nr:thioredoxin-disulfide reductase [candidate division Zixibacteria bacterium]
MSVDYDIIIIGGGPGGLTAGLYAARANMRAILLEKALPGGQIANTHEVEDYPGFEHIGGPELASRMENHARKFGLEVVTTGAEEVWCEGDERVVRTSDGKELRAYAIILATGGSPNLLHVPGENELSGLGVSYCAICDGAFFKDQIIVVVGGGDAAVEEGIFLTRFGSRVIIIHRRDELRAAKIIQKRAFANPKIEFVWDSVVEKINGDQKVTSVSVKNVKTGQKSLIECGAVFIFIGFKPNSDLVREEMEKDAGGYIITNERMETSVPGIYACGDVRHQLVKQITNAVGDATTAAVAAEKYIEAIHDKELINQ